MFTLPFLAVGFLMKLVAGAFIFCSVVLILTVLLQKGRGGGLGAAFGGGVGGGLLGSKTGDFLTWVTIFLVGIFLVLAVVMAKYYKPTVSDYSKAGPAATQSGPSGGGGPGESTAPGGPVLPEEAGEEFPVTGESDTNDI